MSAPSELARDAAAPRRPAAPIALKAGPLTALFEPDSGFLRYIRIGDHEILRCIYGAVRNRNWDTIPARFTALKVESDASSFLITFEADCRSDADQLEYLWRSTIRGEASGNITYTFEGEARSAFLRNRIGLCVLHPLTECTGKPCTVEHTDGSTEQGSFPKFIMASQPFKGIRAIRNEPAPGVTAEVRLEGDTFEMEDQRNWTDASFKTYSTPLEIPYPVAVKPGDRVMQSVTVSLPGQPRRILPVLQGRGAQFSIATTPVLPIPPLGLGMATHGQPLAAREIQRLKKLGLSHLKVDLKFEESNWATRLNLATQESHALGVGLHVALHLTGQAAAELQDLRSRLEALNPKILLWLVHHAKEPATSESLLQLARTHLGSYGSNILFAAGTAANFCEINHHHPSPDSTALPCFSINPQVHAVDDLSLIENLAAQPMTVVSIQQFAPRAVVVSPITLRPRFNPYATAAAENAPAPSWPADADIRQKALFGAGWTLGSLTRLITAGNVHSLTYFETTGVKGVMETEAGSAWPGSESVPQPGTVFPLYHVLADLAGFSKVYPTHSSHPLQTEALTLVNAHNRRRILVCNFLGETQEVKIKTGTCQARIRHLDETSVDRATADPETFHAEAGVLASTVSGKIELKLKPYALARVDVVE